MTAILLALGSSVGYGVSDFLASRVARRVPPVLLVLYSQALQSVVLLVVFVAVRQPYSAGALAWGAASGAIGAAGLVAYYQALATGQTAIVAPLASSGAVLPVLLDLAGGERPGPLALAGLVEQHRQHGPAGGQGDDDRRLAGGQRLVVGDQPGRPDRARGGSPGQGARAVGWRTATTTTSRTTLWRAWL